MALNDARHDEAADHFTDAINSGILSDERLIDPEYEIFVIVCLYPSNKHGTFDTQLWTFYSCLGGTSHPRGKLHTRIGATHSFKRVSWQKPTEHTRP